MFSRGKEWFPIQLSIMCVWTSTESHHVSCFYANCNSRLESENSYMKYKPANQATVVHCTQQFVEIVKWSAFFYVWKSLYPVWYIGTQTYIPESWFYISIDHIATRNHPRNLFLHEDFFSILTYIHVPTTYLYLWFYTYLDESYMGSDTMNSC